MSNDPRTIGRKIVSEMHDLVSIAEAIDIAVANAFKAGVDHVVAGGGEAARLMPQLKDCLPLVMYFKTAQDRQEFSDLINAAKPGMTEHRIPEPRND